MKIFRILRDQKGNAITEFALASFVVFLLGMGATDFGRLFYDGISSAGASTAGSMASTYSPLAAADLSAITAAAEKELQDLSGTTVTAEKICDCPSDPGNFAVDCTYDRCTGYGLPRLYVKTRTQKAFETIVAYPGIPKNTNIDLSNYIRVR